MSHLVTRRLLCITAAGVLVAGCAGSRQDISEISTRTASFSGSDSYLRASVVEVLPVSDGWVEYVLEGTNLTTVTLSQFDFYVIAEDGSRHGAARNIYEIEAPPNVADQTLLMTGIGLGGMGLGLIGIPFVGPLLAGGAILGSTASFDDTVDLALRFERSAYGSSLPGRDSATASAFLPAVRPQGLVVRYVVNGVRRELAL